MNKITCMEDDWALPPTPVASELQVGYSVKINNGRERFFATIVEINGNRIVGRVDNHLVFPGYTYGELVSFEPKHVWIVHTLADKDRIALELAYYKSGTALKDLMQYTRLVDSNEPSLDPVHGLAQIFNK